MIRIILLLIVSSIWVVGQTLPAPEGLKGEWNPESGSIFLNWDSLAEDIAGYHLFVQQPEQDKYYLWGRAGQIHTNSYEFEVQNRQGGTYRFRVAAFSNFPEVIYGEQSAEILVNVPSRHLPMVKGVEVARKKGDISMSWEYPYEIADLAGFEISLNDSTIRVSTDQSMHKFQNLAKATYSVSINAISDSGVRSQASSPKIVRLK